MSSETIQRPDSNVTRIEALTAAFLKHVAMGAGSFLTAATAGRLVTIKPLYKADYDDIAFKKHALNVLSAKKDDERITLNMVNRHFIMVFNFAVERGTFAKEDRDYYKLPVGNDKLPDMTTDAYLMQWTDNIITGETQRIADGGTPMAFPDLAEVQAAATAFLTTSIAQNTATQAFDTAQEKLDDRNEEADKVIKKVWDEVETFYNEEEETSMRANARLWGVVYQRVGGTKKVSGTVTDIDTGAIIPGAKVRMKNGKGFVIADAQAKYELSTTLMDAQELDAEADTFDDFATIITLEEGEDQVVDIKMKKSV